MALALALVQQRKHLFHAKHFGMHLIKMKECVKLKKSRVNERIFHLTPR